MLTLKFGGTSMENAERILACADIILKKSKESGLSVIVSAAAGISNKLQESINACTNGAQPDKFVQELRSFHSKMCTEIQKSLPEFPAEEILKKLETIFCEYAKLLSGCTAFSECPDTIHCRIMGMGELISAPIMEAVLQAKKLDAVMLDSRKFIYTAGNQKEGEPDFERSSAAFFPYKKDAEKIGKILIFPGFICSWISAANTAPIAGLLGRNGSDFSAAVVGFCLDAEKVEFWTDVDGVYTADPHIVKDAVLVKNMSYEEAIELSFFGSKVLHPKTIAPLSAKGIEAWSLNSRNPSARGTRIAKGPFADERKSSICGISCLEDIAMISVSGSGMKGRSGTASRIFAAVSKAKSSVLLITQSSSEYTVSFCVRMPEAQRIQAALNSEFELEIKNGLINPISIYKDCAVVSVVGDGMIDNRGIAAKFLDALAQQDINIVAIAQGSSERCISCVIEAKCSKTAVRAAHAFFFRTEQTIEIFAFGAGTIGGTLIDQIKEQKEKLLKTGIGLKVICIADWDRMILNPSSIDLKNWRETLKASSEKTDIDLILNFVKETKPLNPVFVDCTASYDLPERYIDVLKAGMSIATPNKRANSMKIDFYHELRRIANKMNRRFLYETNVGAGLPIIDTLQNLFKSGDRLTGFSGIMSGSLSYIFGKLDEGVPFSRAVKEAKELRYTEPDPRDDLNGMDVARKALIIAREAGYKIELEDIKLNKVFPEEFNAEGTVEEFMERLPEIDNYFEKKINSLKKQNKVLRMGASIKDGKCSVGMLEVGIEDPLYAVKGGENAFVFHTERYTPIPLTVRGYGAGAGVTAAGIFGDILRTVSFNLENK